MYRTNGTLGTASVTVTPVDLPAGPGNAVAGLDYTIATNSVYPEIVDANAANSIGLCPVDTADTISSARGLHVWIQQ